MPKGNLTSSLSIAFSGGPVGIITALLLAPAVIDSLGWPSVFYICGATGLAWAAYWQPTIPEQPPSLPAAVASTGGPQLQRQRRPAGLSLTTCLNPLSMQARHQTNAFDCADLPDVAAPTESMEETPVRLSDVPLGEFLRTRSLWALLWLHCSHNMGPLICLSW